MRLGIADRLLAALHDGPFEAPPWTNFLQLLREEMDVGYSGIIFRPRDRSPGSVIEIFAGDDAPSEIHRIYRESFYQRDPVMAAHLQEGHVYDIAQLLDEMNEHHLLYRQRILEPRGIKYLKVTRVVEPGGVAGWLFIARGSRPFTHKDTELLAQLGHHFRSSLRNYIALESERLHARVADGAITRLNIGWLTLDATGTVVTKSDQACALLAQNDGLRISRKGGLIAARPSVNATLQAAIGALSTGSARPQAIGISDDPWLHVMLTPYMDQISSLDRTSVMIAFIQGDNRFTARRHEQIVELFGLLPSEARLALLISQGDSIAEAAEKLSITTETARSYTKRIYAKMGLRGQADLVRFILSSVLTLA